MVIEKNGNRYLVKENLNSWSISEKDGKIEILRTLSAVLPPPM